MTHKGKRSKVCKKEKRMKKISLKSQQRRVSGIESTTNWKQQNRAEGWDTYIGKVSRRVRIRGSS